MGGIIRELAKGQFSRYDEISEPLIVPRRSRPIGIHLHPLTINKYREIAKALLITSSHRSQECVGLVLEAYFKGQISGPSSIEVAPPEIVENNKTTRDVHLSRDAWAGLKTLFGAQPSRELNKLAERHADFIVTAKPMFPQPRRHVHHTHIRSGSLNYFAEYAQGLGIEPAAKMGLISWATIFLEYLGRGGVIVAQTDYTRRVRHEKDATIVELDEDAALEDEPVSAPVRKSDRLRDELLTIPGVRVG